MDTDSIDLAGIIGKLMESGEAAEIIGRLKASAEKEGGTQSDDRENNTKDGADSVISSAIDNEQLAEKLPQVMSAIAPLMGQGTFTPARNNGSSERRNDLLRALRPYLNDGRRNMIDRIMTLSRFTGMIDLLGRNTGINGK